MSQISKVFIFFLIVFLGSICPKTWADIVPVPRHLEYKSGESFQLKNSINMCLNTQPMASSINPMQVVRQMMEPAKIINETLKKHLDVNTYLSPRPEKSQVILELVPTNLAANYQIPADKVQEAYVIEISEDKAVLRAFSLKGVFYAAMTFVQIIEDADKAQKHKTLPALQVIDWPDFKVRGVSDDISRGQVPTLKSFKKIIRQLARYKLNTYMLYIEDVVQIDAYPQFGSGRDTLTSDNIKEMTEYAQMYFVDIVPIIETLGHQENLLYNPAFSHLAEFPGAMSLCVACEETYVFLDSLIADIATKFPSEYLHIGADESFDAGYGKSAQLRDSLGVEGLHLLHYQRLYKMCQKHGKKMVLYGDMLLKYPKIIEQLPDDVIIMNWQYGVEDTYPSNKRFAESAKDFWVSPSAHNYKTIFPRMPYAFSNISQLSQDGQAKAASGLVIANWGDLGSETFTELLYPLYAWTAQCGWTNQKAELESFKKAFYPDFFGIKQGEFAQIYEMLSDDSTNFTWHEFWRHPLLLKAENKAKPLPLEQLLEKIRVQNDSIKLMVSNILTEQNPDTTNTNKKRPMNKKPLSHLPDTKRNLDNLSIIDVWLQLRTYYAFKLESMQKLERLYNGVPLDSASRAQLQKVAQANIEHLGKLKATYGSSWSDYYGKIGLGFIFDKFDRLIIYFQEINNALEKWKEPRNRQQIEAKFQEKGLLQTKWLYAQSKDSSEVQEAIFRTSIILNDLPLRAYLQVMANTYAEIKINGNPLDTVYVRNIFSAFLEQRRFGFYVIRKQLRIGENIIEIKVKNYNAGLQKLLSHYGKSVPTAASINVLGEISTLDGTRKIESNANWQVLDKNRRTIEAVLKPSPQPIIAPDFSIGRSSWFER